MEGFKSIIKIVSDLPATPGAVLDNCVLQMPRHMIFLPLTQKALIQYCGAALISAFKVNISLYK